MSPESRSKKITPYRIGLRHLFEKYRDQWSRNLNTIGGEVFHRRLDVVNRKRRELEVYEKEKNHETDK